MAAKQSQYGGTVYSQESDMTIKMQHRQNQKEYKLQQVKQNQAVKAMNNQFLSFGGGTSSMIPQSNKTLKKNILGLHANNQLMNLVQNLKILKHDLKPIKKGNIILLIGSESCGKTTMLSSLIYGPDSMEEFKGKKSGKVGIRQKEPLGNLEIGRKNKDGVYPDFLYQQ